MSQNQDKLIGPVPSRIVEAARLIVTPYEGRVAEFNVAAWLQLASVHNQAILPLPESNLGTSSVTRHPLRLA